MAANGFHSRHKWIAIGAIGTAVGIALCFALSLFVRGEPADGAQLHWTASQEGQTLHLRVDAVEPAVALRGWTLEQEGGVLSIRARKVPVSPLFPSGTFQTSIDLEGVTGVYLGGQKIWPEDAQ